MPTDLPDVARVAIEGSFNSERFVNVMHFRSATLSPLDGTDLAALVGILDDAASDDDSLLNIYSLMDAGLNIDTITATSLDTTTPAQFTAGVNLNGTAIGGDLPPMLSVCLSWKSAIANRKYRGRTFLTGLHSGFINSTNSDRLVSTFVSDMTTALSQWVAAWQANTDWRFIILSETDRQANVAAPYEAVTSGTVNPLVCVQRRRREKPA